MLLAQDKWQRWAWIQVLQVIDCGALRLGLWIQFLQGLNTTSLSRRQTLTIIYSRPYSLLLFLWALWSPIKCSSFYFLNLLIIYYSHYMGLKFCLPSHWTFLSYLILKSETLLRKTCPHNSFHGFESYIGL